MAKKIISKRQLEGMSLKKMQSIMALMAIVISLFLMYCLYTVTGNYDRLSDATEEYISLNNAANGLMEASDYLTEMVQRFTDEGKQEYLSAYFEEAFSNKRREAAIEVISQYPECSDALADLQKALDQSVGLMNREYYAMRLVVEAKNFETYPTAIKNVELSPEDAKLAPEKKMELARKMVLDDEYYNQKDRIKSSMEKSRKELQRIAFEKKQSLQNVYYNKLTLIVTVVIVQTVLFLTIMGITMHLGIKPIVVAAQKIKEGKKIPHMGASEFRYLADTYNTMFNDYRLNMRDLSYKASHDELTDVYNRTGYEAMRSKIELDNVCFVLFDIDDFKRFNDDMGHDMGDRVLKKVAETIKKNFRIGDHIFRIGGDEFAVIMTDIDQGQGEEELIAKKFEKIKAELAASTDDDDVSVSVSIGVAYGRAAIDTGELFEHADKALYETKNSGKNGYTFYKA